mgnify:CR=1 FL=1
MQYSILIILLALGLLIFSVSISEAFAEKVPVDLYKTLKLRHDTNPTICIFEANPEITDKWSDVLLMTVSGINEWRTSLSYTYPDGDWHMPLKQVIPWDNHAEKSADEFRYCNIMINYEKSSGDSSLGNTGLKFNKSYHKYMFINVFLETQRNAMVITLNNSGNSTVENNPIKEMPMNTIKNIVVHELGHALGLGHYFIGTPLTGDEENFDRSVMIPTIKPFEEDQSLIVRPLDTFMLGQLYGNDGWSGAHPPHVVRECYIPYPTVYSCD